VRCLYHGLAHIDNKTQVSISLPARFRRYIRHPLDSGVLRLSHLQQYIQEYQFQATCALPSAAGNLCAPSRRSHNWLGPAGGTTLGEALRAVTSLQQLHLG
jgi:hypothetical protein